jgi:hypothetical protein
MRILPLMLLAPAIIAAAPDVPAEPQAPAPIGIANGTPRECLMTSQIRDTRIIDAQTILFRIGNDWFRNDLAVPCRNLGPSRRITQTTPQNQVCRGQAFQYFTATLPPPGVPLGSCIYGMFTPVTLPKGTLK